MFQQPSPTQTAETHFCGVISVVVSVELPLTQSQLRQLDSPITAGPGVLIFEQTGDEKNNQLKNRSFLNSARYN